MLFPSTCGQYVARVSEGLVVDVLDHSNAPVASFDITVLTRHHLQHAKPKKVGPTPPFQVTLTQLKWERIEETASNTVKCSKLALLLELPLFDVVMVLLLRAPGRSLPEDAPVLIHLPDGIANFDWVPPVATDATAYEQARQIVVFSKNRLAARVYSLDCTHMLFEVPRPVYGQILIRPHSSVWLIVSTTDSLLAVIHHFHNNGSTSVRLTSFLLRTQPGSEISWSGSGKWMLNFDCANQLCGFQFQVYTSLGIYRPIRGDPVISVSNEASELLDYRAEWLLVKRGNELQENAEKSSEVLLEYVVAAGTVTVPHIAVCVLSMDSLRCNQSVLVHPESLDVWHIEKGRFSRGAPTSPMGTLQTIEAGNAGVFALVYPSALVLCELAARTVSVVGKAVIQLSLAVKFVEITGDHVVFATEQEVAIFRDTPGSNQVLFSVLEASVTIVQVEHVAKDAQLVLITSDNNWTTVALPDQAQEFIDHADDSTMNQLRSSEWGLRFKRKRFSLLADSTKEEVTNTFLQSGAKRHRSYD